MFTKLALKLHLFSTPPKAPDNGGSRPLKDHRSAMMWDYPPGFIILVGDTGKAMHEFRFFREHFCSVSFTSHGIIIL